MKKEQKNKLDYSLDDLLKSIPINIEALIRVHGLELNKNADLEEGVLGELRYENGNFKVSVKRTDHYYRKRFTMAHEFAHFILHKDLISGDVIRDFDPEISEGVAAINREVGVTNDQEYEANVYAAKLLMPEELVVQYARDRGIFVNGKIDQIDQDALQEIATAFQVSKAAMEIRINGLKDKISTN